MPRRCRPLPPLKLRLLNHAAMPHTRRGHRRKLASGKSTWIPETDVGLATTTPRDYVVRADNLARTPKPQAPQVQQSL